MAQFVEPEQLTPLQYTGTGEHWLFTENQSIGTHIYLPNEEFMEIDSMGIYADECGSLSLVGISYPAYGDLGLSFTTTTFGVGEVFYIRIFASNAPASYPFSVIVTNGSSPAWCASLGACELLCNPSFENSSNSIYPDPWIANSYTPDYIQGSPHPNMNLSPRSGNAMMGLITFYQNVGRPEERESISIPLEQPVSAGKWVYGEMYVRWDDHASSLVQSGLTDITYLDYLEMLFTQGAFNMNPTLPTNSPTAQITPLDNQGISTVGWLDNTNWKKISGVFEVQGTQVDHLTISNFKNDAFTAGHVYDPNADFAYALVDDVDVQELPGAGSSNVSVCAGQSVQLGTGACNLPTGASISWTPTTGLNNSSIAQPTATVNQTTLYTMTVTYNGITYSDDVQVEVESLANVITTTDDCNINNPSATITIPNFNSANQYSLSSTNGFTYTTATLSGSQYVFSNINYTNYKDVGTYTIDIVAGPDAGCSLQGKIVRCCSGAPLALAQESYSERSDITNWNNQNFEVGDYFTFDEDVVIENSTFWMHPDAQIRIDANADVEFINCTFNVSDCNPPYKWDGIIVQANATALTINQSEIFDAYRGIFNDGVLAPITVTNSSFIDNRSSIVLKNLQWTGNGPLGGGYSKIHGNHFFMAEPLANSIPLHPASPLSINNYLPPVTAWSSTSGPVFQNPAVQIIVDNVKQFKLGHRSFATNRFEAHPDATHTHLLNDGTHVLLYNTVAEIENNVFITEDAQITAEKSTLTIGGNQVGQSNSFAVFGSTDIRGIHLRECSADIYDNDFTEGASIYSINPTATLVNNQATPWHGFGTRIESNSFIGTPISQTQNGIMAPCFVFAKIEGANPPHGHPPFNINKNEFRGVCKVMMENFGPPQLVDPLLYPVVVTAKIYGNGFTNGYGFMETPLIGERAFIAVKNSQSITVAENNINCGPPAPTSSGSGGTQPPSGGGSTPGGGSTTLGSRCGSTNAIFLENCQNCKVNGNGNSPIPPILANKPVHVKDGFGIRIKADVTGTQLHCNVLTDNFSHIYLDNVTGWSNQVTTSGAGADNQFIHINNPSPLFFDIQGNLGTYQDPLTFDYKYSIGGSNTNPIKVTIYTGSLNVLSTSLINTCQPGDQYFKKGGEGNIESPDSTQNAKLEIFPNPSRGMLMIKVPQTGYRAVLRTPEGQVVAQKRMLQTQNQWKLEGLATGMYFLHYNGQIEKLILK